MPRKGKGGPTRKGEDDSERKEDRSAKTFKGKAAEPPQKMEFFGEPSRNKRKIGAYGRCARKREGNLTVKRKRSPSHPKKEGTRDHRSVREDGWTIIALKKGLSTDARKSLVFDLEAGRKSTAKRGGVKEKKKGSLCVANMVRKGGVGGKDFFALRGAPNTKNGLGHRS